MSLVGDIQADFSTQVDAQRLVGFATVMVLPGPLPLPCALASPPLSPSRLTSGLPFTQKASWVVNPKSSFPNVLPGQPFLAVSVCPVGQGDRIWETHRSGSSGFSQPSGLQAVVWALPTGNPENCGNRFSSLPFPFRQPACTSGIQTTSTFGCLR